MASCCSQVLIRADPMCQIMVVVTCDRTQYASGDPQVGVGLIELAGASGLILVACKREKLILRDLVEALKMLDCADRAASRDDDRPRMLRGPQRLRHFLKVPGLPKDPYRRGDDTSPRSISA